MSPDASQLFTTVIQDGYVFRVFGGRPRSPKWAKVRAEAIKRHPLCSACGSVKGLEVHHVEPYHLAPGLELDPDNLIVLCDETSNRCHFTFGHLWDWCKSNAGVRIDARNFLAKAQMTKAVDPHPPQEDSDAVDRNATDPA